MVEIDGKAGTPVVSASPPRADSWWRPVGILAAGVATGLGGLALLVLFARPLALVFLAVCIAAAVSPIIQRMSSRLSRNTGIVVFYLLLLLFIVLVIALLLPTFISQFSDFAQRSPELVARVNQLLQENGISSAQIETIGTEVIQAGRSLISLPFTVLSGLFDAVLVLIVSLYLLIDAPRIRSFSLSLFHPETRPRIDAVSTEMLQVAGGYAGGVVISMVLVSTITSIGLTLIGLPFALVLGVTAGLFEALPVVGSLIAGIPIMIIALLQTPTTALITLVFILIVQQMQGNIVAPAIMNRQVSVPRFLILPAIVAGSLAGGILGALIAVPLTAVLRVLVIRVIAPSIRHHTGAADEPVPPNP